MRQKRDKMNESELNSYRFLSIEEPSDEQLQTIMEAALAEVRHLRDRPD